MSVSPSPPPPPLPADLRLLLYGIVSFLVRTLNRSACPMPQCSLRRRAVGGMMGCCQCLGFAEVIWMRIFIGSLPSLCISRQESWPGVTNTGLPSKVLRKMHGRAKCMAFTTFWSDYLLYFFLGIWIIRRTIWLKIFPPHWFPHLPSNQLGPGRLNPRGTELMSAGLYCGGQGIPHGTKKWFSFLAVCFR